MLVDNDVIEYLWLTGVGRTPGQVYVCKSRLAAETRDWIIEFSLNKVCLKVQYQVLQPANLVLPVGCGPLAADDIGDFGSEDIWRSEIGIYPCPLIQLNLASDAYPSSGTSGESTTQLPPQSSSIK